jgi:hypothetical protein
MDKGKTPDYNYMAAVTLDGLQSMLCSYSRPHQEKVLRQYANPSWHSGPWPRRNAFRLLLFFFEPAPCVALPHFSTWRVCLRGDQCIDDGNTRLDGVGRISLLPSRWPRVSQ